MNGMSSSRFSTFSFFECIFSHLEQSNGGWVRCAGANERINVKEERAREKRSEWMAKGANARNVGSYIFFQSLRVLHLLIRVPSFVLPTLMPLVRQDLYRFKCVSGEILMGWIFSSHIFYLSCGSSWRSTNHVRTFAVHYKQSTLAGLCISGTTNSHLFESNGIEIDWMECRACSNGIGIKDNTG